MTRFVRLRRLLAALLCGCIALSAIETAIADVHDGDAPAGELARAEGPVSALCAESPDRHTEPGGDDHPAHQDHVCHSGHAHLGWLGLPTPPLPVVQPLSERLERPATTAAHFDPDPLVPPPIA